MTLRIHIRELRVDRSLIESETPPELQARVANELGQALSADAIAPTDRQVASLATNLAPATKDSSDLGQRIGRSLGEVLSK